MGTVGQEQPEFWTRPPMVRRPKETTSPGGFCDGKGPRRSAGRSRDASTTGRETWPGAHGNDPGTDHKGTHEGSKP